MKVIVTGHQGYIGSVLVPLLLREGFKVIGIDSDLYSRCNFAFRPLPVPFIRKDIRDIEVSDLEGAEALVHLAGLSNDPLGDLDPELTMDINYQGTVRLAEVAKLAGINRFIFSSSCSLYGAATGKELFETDLSNPQTPYARSKILSEQGLALLADQKFSPTYLRNGTAYGNSPRIRFDLVVNNLTAWAVATGKVQLKSDGSAWRPLVHVKDIAQAFISTLLTPRELVHNQAFNIGARGENFQIRDVSRAVRDTVKGSSISFADGACVDSRCYRVNFDKSYQTLTRFNPRWSLLRGVNELYSAFKTHGIKLNEFEGDRYRRVSHVQFLLNNGLIKNDLRPLETLQVLSAAA